jgi:hypothetical protein
MPYRLSYRIAKIPIRNTGIPALYRIFNNTACWETHFFILDYSRTFNLVVGKKAHNALRFLPDTDFFHSCNGWDVLMILLETEIWIIYSHCKSWLGELNAFWVNVALIWLLNPICIHYVTFDMVSFSSWWSWNYTLLQCELSVHNANWDG